MAREVLIRDDLTGESGATTRRLVLDDRTYTIDLTDEGFDKLVKSLKRWLDKAIETTPVARKPAEDPYSGVSQSDVRSWAVEQGLDVEPKGRVPLALVQAYKQAHEPKPDDPGSPPALALA